MSQRACRRTPPPSRRGRDGNMWIKLAIGAIVGLVLGYFLPPGYALWVVVGIVAGYLVELLTQRRKSKQKAQG